MELQGELPGGEEDGATAGIVVAEVDGVEESLEFGGGAFEIAGVGVTDDVPVGDGGETRGVELDDHVEESFGLGELRGVGFAEEQRAGAIEAEVEINEGEGGWILRELVEIHGAMHLPETFAGEAVLGVEVEGAAEGEQGAAMPANAGIAETTEGVLEDAKSGEDAKGVDEVEGNGEEEVQGGELAILTVENGEAETEHGGDDADLDLGFFLLSGEGEEVEEGDGEQELQGEGSGVFELVGSQFVEQGDRLDAEPGHGDEGEPAGEGEDENESREAILHLAKEAEGESRDGSTADDGEEESLQGGLLGFGDAEGGDASHEEEADESAAEDADVGEGGAFEEEEEDEGDHATACAEGVAEAKDGGDGQGENEADQGGKVDA